MRMLQVAVVAISVGVGTMAALAQTIEPTTPPQNNGQFGSTTRIPAMRPPSSLDLQRIAAMSTTRAKATCYALRSYTFARPDAGSDRTTPVGYSTCQSSSQFTIRQTNGQK